MLLVLMDVSFFGYVHLISRSEGGVDSGKESCFDCVYDFLMCVQWHLFAV